MPKILLVKTSSLGDVVHNLPVVTDIHAHVSNASIDWVVEENFADIPAMHPGVNRVIPVALRRWRKAPFSASVRTKVAAFREQLAATRYDFILDTQGLIKSAVITRLASGTRYGYAWDSAREPLAALFYKLTFTVPKALHAVERNRILAGKAFGYQPASGPIYGILPPTISLPWLPQQPYAVLLHATSRADKQWRVVNWLELGEYFNSIGMACILPWGSDAEHVQSALLSKGIASSIIPPRLTIREIAALLSGARIVVGVDTGIAHLAAALNVPIVAIFCASDPALTGVYTSGPATNLGNYGAPPSIAETIATVERLLSA